MKRRRRTPAQRLAILQAHGSVCYLSGLPIDPKKDEWHLEHVIPLADGGTDNDDNLRPALIKAHIKKTMEDLSRIAKGKRIAAKINGSFEKRGRPIPGSKRSGWKKKMNGEVVRRF